MRKPTPPHSIKTGETVIVAAGASLLGSQRGRRPRPSRLCSGSAAIQSRPGWLAGSAGPGDNVMGVTLDKASALLPDGRAGNKSRFR